MKNIFQLTNQSFNNIYTKKDVITKFIKIFYNNYNYKLWYILKCPLSNFKGYFIINDNLHEEHFGYFK